MITDSELYRLAIFLGCASAILIVVYHFVEVNANKTTDSGKGLAQQDQPAKTQRATQ